MLHNAQHCSSHSVKQSKTERIQARKRNRNADGVRTTKRIKLECLTGKGWLGGRDGGWRQSGNGNGSVGKETKQKLRKWQVRVRQSPARIYLSELCQLLSVSQVSSSSIDSTACHFACRSVANVYCISIKSLPRSSSLLCHLRVRHLLLHREKNCGFLYPLLLWLAVLLFFFELVAKLVVNLRALKLFFLHLTSIKEVIGN